MITIQNNNVIVEETKLEKLQEDYRQSSSFVISDFFGETLQSIIANHLENAEWESQFSYYEGTEKVLAKEFTLARKNKLYTILNFYLNHPKVINTMKVISQHSDLNSFHGRIYKFEENGDCFDTWHNDLSKEVKDTILIGLSVNLSSLPFEGGVFKIRNRDSQELLSSIKHEKWGGAHFFRISPQLEHMVENVSGPHPRVAYAGWFTKKIVKQMI